MLNSIQLDLPMFYTVAWFLLCKDQIELVLIDSLLFPVNKYAFQLAFP